MTRLTPEEILARLSQGYDADADDADEWDRMFHDVIESDVSVNEDSIKAFAMLLEREKSPAALSADRFSCLLRERYQYYWSSPGKYARDYFEEDWAQMGDYPTGREEAVAKLADYVDWDAVADSHELSDHAFVKLDPEAVETGVHVFKDKD